ncbi:unnamed protein product [Lactuca virosa]|uniref:Uncharacterized protein n=1 Tax=Lactuca virosa TaxID=75947 RepID=A0AAU9PRE5_9ASTR|nr:unnamed protein product [Lactuca virosa]
MIKSSQTSKTCSIIQNSQPCNRKPTKSSDLRSMIQRLRKPTGLAHAQASQRRGRQGTVTGAEMKSKVGTRSVDWVWIFEANNNL